MCYVQLYLRFSCSEYITGGKLMTQANVEFKDNDYKANTLQSFDIK